MRKTILVSLLVCGLLLAGAQVFAWPGGQNYGGGCDGKRGHQRMSDGQHEQRYDQHFERMGVILDLTDDQKQELQSLHEQRQEQQQQLHEQMQSSRDQMREAAHADNFDEEEFRTMAQQHADLKTEMMVKMAKSRQQMATILTPEQLEKAEQLKEMRGDRCNQCGDSEQRGRFHKQRKGSCYSS